MGSATTGFVVPIDAPAKNVPAAQALPSHEALVGKYIETRDKIDEIKSRHKAELEPEEDKLSIIEEYFKQAMHLSKADSEKYKTGMAIRSEKTKYTAVDRSVFFDWIRETNNTDLLEGRLSQTEIKKWAEQNGGVPPGVFAKTAFSVTFRRPKTVISTTSESN